MRKTALLLLLFISLSLLGSCSYQNTEKAGPNFSNKELQERKLDLQSSETIKTGEKYNPPNQNAIELGRFWANKEEQFLSQNEIAYIIKLLDNSIIVKDSDIEVSEPGGCDVALNLKDEYLFLKNVVNDDYVVVNNFLPDRPENSNNYLIYNKELNRYITNLRKRVSFIFKNIDSLEINSVNEEHVVIKDIEILSLIEKQLNKSVYIGPTKCPFDNKITFNSRGIKTEAYVSSDGCNVLKIGNDYLLLTDKVYKLLNEKVKLVGI